MSIWKSIIKELPANNQVVWIRVWNIYGQLALATFNASNDFFTINETGVVIPSYQVSRWKEYTPPPSSTLLLDVYPGASSAYSVFQLTTNAQFAMQIQRLSDNELLNVPFTNGYVDTSIIEDFIGAGGAYLNIWYDQSGNGLHMVNQPLTSLPFVMASGNLVLKNGKLAVDFSSSNRFHISFVKNFPQPNTEFAVASLNPSFSPSLSYTLASSSVNATRQVIFNDTSGVWAIFANSSLLSTVNSDSNQHLFTALYNTTSSILRLDGSQIASGNAGNASNNGTHYLGRSGTAQYWNGLIQERIVYPSNQTSNFANIEANINDRFNIY